MYEPIEDPEVVVPGEQCQPHEDPWITSVRPKYYYTKENIQDLDISNENLCSTITMQPETSPLEENKEFLFCRKPTSATYATSSQSIYNRSQMFVATESSKRKRDYSIKAFSTSSKCSSSLYRVKGTSKKHTREEVLSQVMRRQFGKTFKYRTEVVRTDTEVSLLQSVPSSKDCFNDVYKPKKLVKVVTMPIARNIYPRKKVKSGKAKTPKLSAERIHEVLCMAEEKLQIARAAMKALPKFRKKENAMMRSLMQFIEYRQRFMKDYGMEKSDPERGNVYPFIRE